MQLLFDHSVSLSTTHCWSIGILELGHIDGPIDLPPEFGDAIGSALWARSVMGFTYIYPPDCEVVGLIDLTMFHYAKAHFCTYCYNVSPPTFPRLGNFGPSIGLPWVILLHQLRFQKSVNVESQFNMGSRKNNSLRWRMKNISRSLGSVTW